MSKFLGTLASGRRMILSETPARGQRSQARAPVINIIHDLRYAARAGVRQPMPTLAIILTFALGIGVTTAIFSVVNAALFRPLPYANSDRLVMVWGNFLKLRMERMRAKPAEFADYRDRINSFDLTAAFRIDEMSLTGDREPEPLNGVRATPNLLRMLGTQTLKGRIFTDEESKAGRDKVAIISSSLWQRRFGSDPNIIGRAITLSGENYVVVGILDSKFEFPHRSLQFSEPADLWIPLVLSDEQVASWSGNWELNVIARLKDGVTLEEARAELAATAVRFEESNRGYRGPGGIDAGWRITAVSLSDEATGRSRRSMYFLLAIAGLVLVLACVNVANLLLARSTARLREMAVRSALGASRTRLLQLILTESAVLSLIGGVIGLLIAAWTLSLALSIGVEQVPRLDEANIDLVVLAFALAISLLVGVVCGLISGLRLTLAPSNEVLRNATSSTGGPRRRRLSDALVVVEIAVTFCVLVSAMLLLRSMRQLERSESGLISQGVLGAEIALSPHRYTTPAQKDGFFRQLHEQLSALPGVESVGLSSVYPLSGEAAEDPFSIEGRPLDPNQMTTAGRQAVSRGFFRTLGIPIVRGRDFQESDSGSEHGAAIINEAMAEQFWPGTDPIGQRLKLGAPRAPGSWLTIVGVVRNIPHRQLGSQAQPDWYFPVTQRPQSRMYAFARGPGDVSALATSIRQAVARIDREQPVSEFKQLDEVIGESLIPWRFSSLIAASFAVLALFLSIGGVYSTTSYLTAQRTREFGVRLALGARSTELVRMVIGKGMVQLAFGMVLGAAGALVLARSMKTLLFGVAPSDPVSFLLAAVLIGAITIFSGFLPAFRAGRTDPSVALRCE